MKSMPPRARRDVPDTDRYERFTATAEYRASRREKAGIIAHLCRPYLAGSAVAVDLGAGTGIIRKILEVECGNPIYGLEIDGSFIVDLDFAMLNHLYEHVPDPAGLFRETYRVLKPGGRAYVTAGSRWAVMEPHYRLPFLSWLPKGVATRYLKATGRGSSYDEIRFLGYRRLTRLMRAAGFILHDVTEKAIDDLIGQAWGPVWAAGWRTVRRAPDALRRSLLRLGSPQWFFFLERPPRPADAGIAR